MSWYAPPELVTEMQSEAVVAHLTGDWMRDLPLEVKRAAARQLDHLEESEMLILDLTSISILDSWGEEKVGELLIRVRDSGGAVAWVQDATREAEYAGLVRALERRKVEVPMFSNVATALGSVGAA